MSARDREYEAHERLRQALRDVAREQTLRRAAEAGEDPPEDVLEAVTQGVLVDYVTVAVYDTSLSDSTVTAISRTDGRCAQYRAIGLLKQALRDELEGP